MDDGLDQIKKSIQDAGEDKIIVDFLIEILNEHTKGIWGFEKVYNKVIDKYLPNWDDDNEN